MPVKFKVWQLKQLKNRVVHATNSIDINKLHSNFEKTAHNDFLNLGGLSYDHQVEEKKMQANHHAAYFYIKEADQIIASLRYVYYQPQKLPQTLVNHYGLCPRMTERLAIVEFDYLLVHKRHLSQQLVQALLYSALEHLHQQKCHVDLLCSSIIPSQSPLLKSLGFKRRSLVHHLYDEQGLHLKMVCSPHWDITLKLNLIERLMHMRLLKRLSKKSNSMAAVSLKSYLQALPHENELEYFNQVQFEKLKRTAENPMNQVILQSLHYSDLMQYAKSYIEVPEGKRLFFLNNTNQTFFLLLEGTLEYEGCESSSEMSKGELLIDSSMFNKASGRYIKSKTSAKLMLFDNTTIQEYFKRHLIMPMPQSAPKFKRKNNYIEDLHMISSVDGKHTFNTIHIDSN